MSERKVLKDILETYKYLPCLWNTSDKFYMNKVARTEAYQILFDKYKAIDSEANIDSLKKKLENMRASFRREFKKVIASRRDPDYTNMEYKPTLWYYDLLLFLEEKKDARDDECLIVPKRSCSSGDEEGNGNDSDEGYNITNNSPSNKLIYSPPIPKRKKIENTTVFITQDDEHNDDTYPSQSKDTLEPNDVREVEAFGRTIGLQLKGLSDMQRHIAEKLMSDIIYFGRLNQLTLNTKVSLNEDFT